MYKLTTDDIESQTPEITEPLHELARKGARKMILAALELEVDQYVQALHHLTVLTRLAVELWRPCPSKEQAQAGHPSSLLVADGL